MATTDNTGERRSDARAEFDREATDLELEPIKSEEEDYESAPPDYRIATYPADYTLEVLHQKWKAGDIRIPDFQRGFVWKQTQASKLIESFLVGLPVPAVFLYSERSSQKYLVIDGQQRLKSVVHYLDGYFGEEGRGRLDENNMVKTMYGNILTNRNLVAHGEGSNATMREVKRYYEEGHVVLDYFRDALRGEGDRASHGAGRGTRS